MINILHTIQIKEKFFIIPYVLSISESFSPISNMFHCKLTFSITNTLKSFIKRGKDKNYFLIKMWSIRSHVIIARLTMLIKTKRKLSTRICEHISDIKKRILESVISDH